MYLTPSITEYRPVHHLSASSRVQIVYLHVRHDAVESEARYCPYLLPYERMITEDQLS